MVSVHANGLDSLDWRHTQVNWTDRPGYIAYMVAASGLLLISMKTENYRKEKSKEASDEKWLMVELVLAARSVKDFSTISAISQTTCNNHLLTGWPSQARPVPASNSPSDTVCRKNIQQMFDKKKI